MRDDQVRKRVTLRQWVARVGIGGVLFFTLKGLLWLLLPALVAYCAAR